MIILAGDIGATKTHLGLYNSSGTELSLIRDHTYVTHDSPSLEAMLLQFLGPRSEVAVACFGVPGPVVDGFARPTNVDWEIHETSIAAALNGAAIRVVNDLEATAYGMLHLSASEIAELHPGEQRHSANIAVIAAGTGLGEAGLVAARDGWNAVASEGGHCDFAPRGDQQVRLLRFLEREFGHASFERVLSGPGLHNIYRFLLEDDPAPEPQWLAERMRARDDSAVISEAALNGQEARCSRALEIFTEIYGAEAANLALKFLSFGGVYLGGGIAPKILPFLQQRGFMRAFLSKGRLHSTLERMPVRVSLNQDAALVGAANLAFSIANSGEK
jgi:glucokinase